MKFAQVFKFLTRNEYWTIKNSTPRLDGKTTEIVHWLIVEIVDKVSSADMKNKL
jgi:hypothetical protein